MPKICPTISVQNWYHTWSSHSYSYPWHTVSHVYYRQPKISNVQTSMIPRASWAIYCRGTGHTNEQDLQLYHPTFSRDLAYHQPKPQHQLWIHNNRSKTTLLHQDIRKAIRINLQYKCNKKWGYQVQWKNEQFSCNKGTENDNLSRPIGSTSVRITYVLYILYAPSSGPFKLIFSYNLPYSVPHQPTFSREVQYSKPLQSLQQK